MKSIAAVFPGQGSQHEGMAKELIQEFPYTKLYFEEASDALKLNFLKLCTEGSESDLQKTENAQPCLLLVGYSWFQVLRKEQDFNPKAAAGHSLGEYTAIVSAEGLPLASAVQLVKKRGELMQQAVPFGVGKMAALLGLDDAQVQKLCEEATQGDHSLVTAANFNAPGQVVIAGHAGAVDRAQTISQSGSLGFKARKFIELKVSAPFHCPLMKPVAEKFEIFLKSEPWKNRHFPIVHNLDASSRVEGDLIAVMRDQINHPVLWTQCQKKLQELGTTGTVEFGPGRVLAGLGKRIVTDHSFYNIETAQDIKGFKAWLES